ncbi:hypothetical protein [Deinococcus radiotolerans]|uniref:Orc1-like AAA ATPase domain-containing protein n=1 Tax=Deinococcus radiotolerans TaxID=1309407 RepID=A0ABQ2FRW8_9DEIO|nr:hypothetical protein [Deinococcus radiotolerans]GGL20087.1 hypothetical protein GCM10010844_43740 [Deinococcus radiotolerans]
MPEQLSPVPLPPNGLPHRSAPAGARLLSVSGAAGRGKCHLLRTLDTGAVQRLTLTAPDLFAPLVRALHGSTTTREPHVLQALRAAAPDLPWPAVAAAPDGPATDAERRDVTE